MNQTQPSLPLPRLRAGRVRTLWVELSIARRTSWLATLLALLAGALIAASALAVLYIALHSSVDQRITSRLNELTTAAGRGTSTEQLLAQTGAGIDLVALADQQGTITATATDLDYPDNLTPSTAGEHTAPVEGIGGQGTEYRVLGRTLTVQGQTYLLMVGIESDQDRLFYLVAGLVFALMVPISALTTGWLTRRFVTSALTPVETIRSEVAHISDTELSRRVPVPAGKDEIAALAGTMNDMLARLETAQKQQLRFIGDASHELRSPLATLGGLAEIAEITGEPIDLETVRTLITPEVTRMQGLVDDLLASASAQAGVFETLDLADLVTAEQARLTTLHPSLTVDGEATPFTVRGNRSALVRALRNLADNAARYSSQQVRVSLSSAQDGSALIRVEDDGPGIRPEDRDLVLQRFGRTDASRARTTGGAGLGLAIVTDIAAAHGGRLSLGDSPLGGLEATLILPAPAA